MDKKEENKAKESLSSLCGYWGGEDWNESTTLYWAAEYLLHR